MDVITYALLKKKVDNVTLAYTYQGSVDSVSDLPSGANLGDLYTVGGTQYVFDGSDWIALSITDAQIDALD